MHSILKSIHSIMHVYNMVDCAYYHCYITYSKRKKKSETYPRWILSWPLLPWLPFSAFFPAEMDEAVKLNDFKEIYRFKRISCKTYLEVALFYFWNKIRCIVRFNYFINIYKVCVLIHKVFTGERNSFWILDYLKFMVLHG